MGIYDRDYYRVGPRSGSGLGRLRFVSFNTWLIIVNVGVYLLGNVLLNRAVMLVDAGNEYVQGVTPEQVKAGVEDRSGVVQIRPGVGAYPIILPPAFPGDSSRVIGRHVVLAMDPIEAFGHFSTYRGFWRIEVWRFITFQFLHGGFWHLFFNMFGLWVFGGMVEQALGFKRYAAFYLTCGIFGALSYLLLNLLGAGFHLRLPGVLINELWTPLVGASAGVFGVIVACAYIAPNAVVQLLFPPIPLPLKWFAYGYVAVAAWNLFTSGNNAGGDAAHLGGAAAGFFFIRNSHLLRDFFDVLGDSRKPRPVRGPAQQEVDRILAKVANEGLHSLSDQEKRLLRQATESRRNG
jgi:membrane associated rhomboid family serine protease